MHPPSGGVERTRRAPELAVRSIRPVLNVPAADQSLEANFGGTGWGDDDGIYARTVELGLDVTQFRVGAFIGG